MLKEKAAYYYGTLNRSCAESMLLAANEVYGLSLTDEEIRLFAGFRTGMGCGSTCGALVGAIGVLSRMYGNREDLKELCGRFVAVFEKKMDCGTTDCKPLEAKYRTEENRCTETMILAAEALEAFVDALEGKTASAEQTISPEDIKRVKGLGFLQHKGTTRFNARVITRNGRITDTECAALAEAARRFGDGHMMMTTRLTVEVSGIEYENIDAFRKFLAEYGLDTGGTGSKVRPVVSCKGSTCQYGLCDTYDLSEKIHQRFYLGYRGVVLPHKFKIAVGGCPNNCVKPNLNDLGIVGQRVPKVDAEKCRGCKKCQVEQNCPIKIAKVGDGKLQLEGCNNCGRCKGKCPFDAVSYQDGFRVYIGGRWGKKVAQGQPLTKVFTSEEEVMDVVEKAILLFRDEGISGERFADTVNRLGFETVNRKLLSGNIDKDSILNKTVYGGASC